MEYNTSIVRRRRLLALFYGAIGGANLIRAALAPQVAPTLTDWSLSLPLKWLAAFYLAWGVAFVGAAFLVLRRARHDGQLRWVLPLAGSYQLALGVLALSAARASYARSLWARDLLLTGIFLGLTAFLARDKA